MLKRIWADPVWSKVIATAIVAVGVLGAGWFFNLLSSAWGLVLTAFSYLGSTTLVWNWLLLIMAGCTLLVVGMILWESRGPKGKNNQPEWTQYRSDEFAGFRWHWRYNSFEEIVDLFPCCPTCDYQVLGRKEPFWLDFECHSCGKTVQVNEDLEELESKVRRLIQQKLRTGSWRAVVDAQNAADQQTRPVNP